MKGMLTGPVTILNWSWPREDITHEQQTQQLALAIRDDVSTSSRRHQGHPDRRGRPA